MKKEIYQIQLTLNGSKPKIWRRLLVPSSMLLSDLHKVIQTTMGWENYHLHHFKKDDKFYSPRTKDDPLWDDKNNLDYKKIRIHDLLLAEKDKIVYEYDFGDSWEHIIVLEKILPLDPTFKHPVCQAGKMRCPPEDSGGIDSYVDLLEKLQDPKSPGYSQAADWLGTEYDPEYFDREEINSMLRSKNFGCF